MQPNEIETLVKNCRSFEIDHDPEGWPAIQMQEISDLCSAVEQAIPALDILQARLEQGAEIKQQNEQWWLFDKNGDGITYGNTVRGLIVNLIFCDC